LPTFIALLRGVNVGGRKVPMSELRTRFDELGHTDVRTYIQSGNVVFDAKGQPARVRAEIEQALQRAFGFEIAVLLRTPAELASVVKRNPFGGDAYVTFLDVQPERGFVAAIDADAYLPDEFVVDGREVYVRCPNGYGRTKINNTFFERKLATRATTRNWNTVTLLLEWATTGTETG
jgi:uncharacterized protein (DUF1697 family)